jgi:hypothetical protein
VRTWLLGLIFVGSSILVSIAGMALVRSLVPLSDLSANNDIGDVFVTVLGTIDAVLLAFVVYVVWTQFTAADSAAAQEASQIVDLWRITRGLPEQIRHDLRSAIENYVHAVVGQEWESMSRSRENETAYELLLLVWEALHQFEPQTGKEISLYSEALRRLNDLSDSRRQRILSSQDSVPRLLWIVLLIIGGATVSFTFLMGAASSFVQALMTAAVAGSIALLLFVIAVMNHPFAGAVRVQPDDFEYILSRFDKTEQV